MVMFIPARARSARIPGKALRPLGGTPLIVHTIASSLRVRGVEVVVCSEDQQILDLALAQGASTWRRPLWTAASDAPDISWLTLALDDYSDETFIVRRPTSPFLTTETVQRAIEDFDECKEATAMRAMRAVREHPMKMWVRDGLWMARACGGSDGFGLGTETHSCPTQILPRVYVQTAGLELIRRATIADGSLTGDRLLPLFLEGDEALDLNTPEDWREAEAICERG